MRHYYYYFNRASTFDYNGREEIPNLWYNGIKVATYKTLLTEFKGDMVTLRRLKGCNADLSSKIINL
jgi:hypothetical protein